MGYNTYFSLKVDGTEYDQDVHKFVFDFFMNKHDFVPCDDYCKWYTYDDDMLELSRLFPSIKFELHGDGEDEEDLWTTYYLNGKKQRCQAQISYDPFDINKLQ